MLGLREEPLPYTELPTRAMSGSSRHCFRRGPTLLYRKVAGILSAPTIIEMDLVLQDDQGKTSAHKALEKKAEKGKEILELILLKHPKCGEILDHKGKSPTDS